MEKRILYIFTRTPLHVGAGSSVGAIDQPIQRERHTGFPIIPASSLKGTFADAWPATYEQDGKKNLRFQARRKNSSEQYEVDGELPEGAWLFGSNNDKLAFAGAAQFSEAKLLAFPIRSAKGSFAWITCPLILRRAARDGVLDPATLPQNGIVDGKAVFTKEPLSLELNENEQKVNKIVLEEYTFAQCGNGEAKKIGDAFQKLLPDDPVWNEVSSRLVILSDGMMSFFAQNACEIAQHVRISDETGTAEDGALFNQENVPSETLFYSVVHFFKERTPGKNGNGRSPENAANVFGEKLEKLKEVFQFGGDASTGLGYCTVKLREIKKEEANAKS